MCPPKQKGLRTEIYEATFKRQSGFRAVQLLVAKEGTDVCKGRKYHQEGLVREVQKGTVPEASASGAIQTSSEKGVPCQGEGQDSLLIF